MKVIPIYIEAGITGFESPAAEYKELGLSLDNLLIKHPNATFIGLASGSSMQGVGIFDKDLLIVDRSLTPLNGDIIVCNYNGNFTCKILDKVNRRLVSASDMHNPVTVYPDDDFQLEGVVSRSIRMHKQADLSCML
ncbi:S24 family peptidase [Thalassotalea sp. G2M2-11]|uniref:LexA family protein n=1 Tax=Thalassotalea sp. G2M2-11 TaxID=2787627 RepID=UPI0019D1F064|nr:S24 family peptidase [Thalassotalea sp. G2M2-11]